MKKGESIREMLRNGVSYNEIARKVGVAKATISYHANKIGLSKGKINRYDWKKIGEEISDGATLVEIRKKYGCCKASIDKARARGAINYSTIAKMTASEYAASITTKTKSHHRRALRKRMVREGCSNSCATCGIHDWNGKKIMLEVDHIDGNSNNNARENLRLLCPNCHSQTPTWRGRNCRNRLQNKSALCVV